MSRYIFFPFDASQDVQQVQKQILVVNPEEERLACFLDRSGKRHGFPVHGILEEFPVYQQGVPFGLCLFQKKLHIIPFLMLREIEEMMAAQAEQDFRYVFSCAAGIRIFIRTGDQIADEFLPTLRIVKEIGYEKAFPVFFVGDGTGLPSGNTAFERKIPIMLFHLFLQLLSGSGDRPQAGKIASVYMETEQIQSITVE